MKKIKAESHPFIDLGMSIAYTLYIAKYNIEYILLGFVIFLIGRYLVKLPEYRYTILGYFIGSIIYIIYQRFIGV